MSQSRSRGPIRRGGRDSERLPGGRAQLSAISHLNCPSWSRWPRKVDQGGTAEIEAETGEETYNLPKQQEFHVGAKFPVEGPQTQDIDCSALGPDVTPTDSQSLTADELDLIDILDGLPVTATPYADVAAELDTDTEWVIRTIKRFNQEGKVRRVGVIPNHYALGYTENGMTVWNVPDDVVRRSGRPSPSSTS